MRFHIATQDQAERYRLTRLIQCSLSRQQAEIESLLLENDSVIDNLGTSLNRCRLRTVLKRGQPIEIEEVQSSLDLAVTRVTQRCMRTVQRRTGVTTSKHSA